MRVPGRIASGQRTHIADGLTLPIEESDEMQRRLIDDAIQIARQGYSVINAWLGLQSWVAYERSTNCLSRPAR
jgi:hypothetical protein